MGFSEREKMEIEKNLRPLHEIEKYRENEISDEILEYLKSNNLLRNIRDYAIFPRGKHKVTGCENITVVKYYSSEQNFANYVEDICGDLTPPFEIKIEQGE